MEVLITKTNYPLKMMIRTMINSGFACSGRVFYVDYHKNFSS